MIGNDAGELLAQDVYGETALDRLKDQAENGTMKPQFREDLRAVLGLATRTTPASAGVLAEALRVSLESNIGVGTVDARIRSAIIDNVLAAARHALSTTATPASDGVTIFRLWECGVELPTDWSGGACLYTDGTLRNPVGRDWHPWGDEPCIRAYPVATPTPDRFGEGYRACEWQDIASAPRDGTLFDIWVPGEASGWRMTNLWFSENGKLYKQGHSRPADLPRWPTHWRPVPDAPATEQSA